MILVIEMEMLDKFQEDQMKELFRTFKKEDTLIFVDPPYRQTSAYAEAAGALLPV